jgi:hypothetical protein
MTQEKKTVAGVNWSMFLVCTRGTFVPGCLCSGLVENTCSCGKKILLVLLFMGKMICVRVKDVLYRWYWVVFGFLKRSRIRLTSLLLLGQLSIFGIPFVGLHCVALRNLSTDIILLEWIVYRYGFII